jgi:hypothetical protein
VGGGLYRAAKCAPHDSSLTWNIKGPAGPQGAPGPSLHVRATENGAMFQHSAGVTVKKVNTVNGPYYLVTFKQNISKCVPVVGQSETSGNAWFPGLTLQAEDQSDPSFGGVNNPHEILVFAMNASGISKSAGFDLIVAC